MLGAISGILGVKTDQKTQGPLACTYSTYLGLHRENVESTVFLLILNEVWRKGGQVACEAWSASGKDV